MAPAAGEVTHPPGGGGHSDGSCCPGGPEEETDETPLELPVGDTEPEPSLLEGTPDVGGDAADTTAEGGQGHFNLHASFEIFKDFYIFCR